MASLPDYVIIEFPGGWSERPAPSVERVEMERGPAKQRLLNSQIRYETSATFRFRSKADAVAFENWYITVIRVIGSFTMIHPLTEQVITANFIAGDIGELVPLDPMFRDSARQVRLEYMR